MDFSGIVKQVGGNDMFSDSKQGDEVYGQNSVFSGGSGAFFEVQKEFISDLERTAATANQNVSFHGVAARVGFKNPWFLFSVYIDAVNKQCEGEMMAKWENRLG